MIRWLALGFVACVAVVYLWREVEMMDAPEIGVPPAAPVVVPVEAKVVPEPEARENSIAQSETDVIAFSALLDDQELSRSERVKALQELGPGALQAPAERTSVSADRPLADAPASDGPGAEPDKHELAAARRRVDITMYSTSWCGVCETARAYFKKQGVSFSEYDVDKNQSARAEYLRLNPRRTVPTIKMDDKVMVGFSPGGFEKIMDNLAKVRLN